jgi:hypothetical protein
MSQSYILCCNLAAKLKAARRSDMDAAGQLSASSPNGKQRHFYVDCVGTILLPSLDNVTTSNRRTGEFVLVGVIFKVENCIKMCILE